MPQHFWIHIIPKIIEAEPISLKKCGFIGLADVFQQQRNKSDNWIYLYTSLQGTQRCPSYSKLLPPFILSKSTHSTYDLKTNLKTFSRVPPNQNLRQIVPGVSELWRDKQTNRDYNFIFKDIFRVSLYINLQELWKLFKFYLNDNIVFYSNMYTDILER